MLKTCLLGITGIVAVLSCVSGAYLLGHRHGYTRLELDASQKFNETMDDYVSAVSAFASDSERNHAPAFADAIAALDEQRRSEVIPKLQSETERILAETQLQFSRISDLEYDAWTTRNRRFEFNLDKRVPETTVAEIVSYIESHPFIDPRILSIESYDLNAVRIRTGEASDNWGFQYIARHQGDRWIVRYDKGWTA